jgi:hypothetical protein
MEKEEILQIFRNYLSGKTRLNDLEDWVLSRIQGILNSGDQEAIALIDRVDALLIEIGAGLASEEDLFNAIACSVSDADTIRLDLSLNEAPDVSVLSVKQSTDSYSTEPPTGLGLYPQFA